MKIIQKNSPNHYNGRSGWKADIIVFHQTGNNSVETSLAWYMNPNSQCCPHFVINTDGTVYQLISLNNGSYANGTRTTAGDKLYFGYSLSEIVRSRKTNANFYTYSIEFVHCQWGNITEKQIQAASELIATVIFPHMRKNGINPKADREHFIGHSHVTPKTRDPEKCNCPGKKFPYDEIIARVKCEKVAPSPNEPPSAKILTKKQVRLAFAAAVRDRPSVEGKRVDTYYPGETITVVDGTETKDNKSQYIYIRVDSPDARWIVRSAIQ